MSAVADALEGFIVGILLFFVAAYALQTHRAYPAWLLAIFYEPWIFVVWAAAVMVIWTWSIPVALAALLIGIAIVLDIYLLGALPTTVSDQPENPDSQEPGPPVDDRIVSSHYSLFA
jgi:hypothetical protein